MKLPQCNRRPMRSLGHCVTQLILATLAIIQLSGCASTRTPSTTSEPEPRSGTVRAFDAQRPVVALVLSGGSARGFAHIGVIRALEQMGIEPDLIVGTSAGSIVGAGYAAGMTANQLEDAARRFDKWLFMDLAFPKVGLPLIPSELGLIRGDRLQRFVDELVQQRPIESLPRRLAVAATDLQTGKTTLFTHGCTGLAVRASSSVPGLFTPPSIGGRLYVDGQVSSPLPVQAARSLGADVVIAVDTTYPPDHADVTTTAGVLFQSFLIAGNRIKDTEVAAADIVIRPEIKTSGQLGFEDRDWLIVSGEVAARSMRHELLRLTKR
jgi:NTE family protein